MLSTDLIAKRLKRFETIAGVSYPNPEGTLEIWVERFGRWDEKMFISICSQLEGEIKWRNLPTLSDMIELRRNYA